MKDWRLIPLEVKDGYWNMALDEATLEHVIGKKSSFTLRFYKWDPSTVSIGRNQSLSAEVEMNVAKNSGYNVVRRITGGGAVFHDREREITYSIVCSIKFLEDLDAHTTLEQFEIIETGIVNGLRFYGLNPEKGVIHCPAIFLDGKKFSGNAQVRRKGYILQHGTILLDLNPEMMYSVLKAPFNVDNSFSLPINTGQGNLSSISFFHDRPTVISEVLERVFLPFCFDTYRALSARLINSVGSDASCG